MRVNVYSEEMTNRIEIVSKTTPDGEFTGLRFYLELPASTFRHAMGDQQLKPSKETSEEGFREVVQVRGPFIHRPGDDDSSAVTFWGKRDLRKVLKIAQDKLDLHYASSDGIARRVPSPALSPTRSEIVCLCGSTRFYDEFQKANYRLTMEGKIVLTVGFYLHSQEQAHGEEVGCTPEQKKILDELHFRKIDLADSALILNKGGYVGTSTFRELAYAMAKRKRVEFLEPKAGLELLAANAAELAHLGNAFLKEMNP